MPTTTTTTTNTRSGPRRPRVWLVAGLGTTPAPTGPLCGLPTVRDDRHHLWAPGVDGRWHTPDGRHHTTWDELHARTDLVEVTPVTPVTTVAAVVALPLPDRELGDGDDDTNASAWRSTGPETVALNGNCHG